MDTCAACKQSIEPSEKPARDKKGRLFHRSCAKRLMEQQKAKQGRAAGAVAITTGSIPLDDEPAGAMDALLGDLVQPEAAGRPCPGCGSPCADDAVLCVGCGYSFETGSSLKTKTKSLPGPAAQAATGAATTSAAWVLALAGAGIGGAVGAAAWAAVGYFLNAEIGYVAVLVGFLSGLGAALFAKDHAGVVSGLIAVCVAVVAIFAGKFALASIQINEFTAGIRQEISASISDPNRDWMTDDDAILALVDLECVRAERRGERLDWAAGMEYDSAYELDDYPQPIVSRVQAQFNAKSVVERRAAKDSIMRDRMVASMADEIAYEREEQGQPLAWPAGMDYERAFLIEDYPNPIVAECRERWDGMTRVEQAGFVDRGLTELADRIDSGEFTAAAMVNSYSGKDLAFDALWIVIAAAAAFAAGKGGAD